MAAAAFVPAAAATQPAAGAETAVPAAGDGAATDDATVLARVNGMKSAANGKFKAGDVSGACSDYERAFAMLEGVSSEAKEKATLGLALRLNSANCALKTSSFAAALGHAEAAVAIDGTSAKAAFRRGQALQGLGRMAEAEAAYREVLHLDPSSLEASTKLQELMAAAAFVPAAAA